MSVSKQYLSIHDHSRELSGLKYIYSVISRRAGGLSIGVNLNINNACNWQCIYCEIPNLTRGSPPPIELDVLENELRFFLHEIIHGDYMEKNVAIEDRHLKDIAFSGNGEPTSAEEFPQVILIVKKILEEFNLLHKIKIRLITNGSLMHKESVLEGIQVLANMNGEVWFKVDAALEESTKVINQVNIKPQQAIDRLKRCSEICPTFVQTCIFTIDNKEPNNKEIDAYIKLLDSAKKSIKGVHLYGIARPSMQPEAYRLGRVNINVLENIADQLHNNGIESTVSY
ncbi:radical SAM protein [Candidatus Methylopumilus planktonicus]|uniref:radical SAM protein n=1 Tax=Candidatus Methylopumilus planktonicus TaxID=1581557 RepID=UPI001121AA47|nr:radical SAM protein [Candidatus Methylopumilus planktonicus]QDD06288.1 radical SAM protein [Candidatus Methylopumilus planktonicus]QDD07623.1 radical SAM protein [Candidatus Methylopumilus planktonicus]QDD08950.1 radical SAM protein [Candidatus Methylopumilus planktonicus]